MRRGKRQQLIRDGVYQEPLRRPYLLILFKQRLQKQSGSADELNLGVVEVCSVKIREVSREGDKLPCCIGYLNLRPSAANSLLACLAAAPFTESYKTLVGLREGRKKRAKEGTGVLGVTCYRPSADTERSEEDSLLG